MENITEDMLRFKEAARHIWNAYFVETLVVMSPGLHESFETIERELLRALVLLPRGVSDMAETYRRGPMPILLQARSGLTEVPVQFGTVDANRNIQWELPCSTSVADVPQYRFIEFFDWDPYGRIDLGQVKAQAVDGRLVLIAQVYCGFVLETKCEIGGLGTISNKD